jgi:hypothetical protein
LAVALFAVAFLAVDLLAVAFVAVTFLAEDLLAITFLAIMVHPRSAVARLIYILQGRFGQGAVQRHASGFFAATVMAGRNRSG